MRDPQVYHTVHVSTVDLFSIMARISKESQAIAGVETRKGVLGGREC